MPDQDRDNQELRAELEELRFRLEEAEETLRAISEGEVDAVVVSGPRGEQVYALSESLQEHMHFLQTLLDAIPNPVFYKGVNRLFLGCNRAYADFIGLTKEEIVGKTVEDLYPPDLAATYTKSDQELLDRPGVQVFEAPIIYANGSRRQVIAHKTTFTNVDGAVAGILGVLLDITERKQAEEALSASAQKWRTTFDAISDAICLMDNNFKLVQCNQAMMDLLGKPADEIIGGTCWKLVHGADGPIDGCPILRMKETLRPETLVLPLGDRWLEVSVYPVLDEAGGLGGAVHIISDITVSKQAEEALQRAKDELEDRVAARTVELRQANELLTARTHDLEQRHCEASWLSQMSDVLQNCRTMEEAHKAVAKFLRQLFPADSGALFIFGASRRLLEAVATWGEKPIGDEVIDPDDCWALRLGRTHLAAESTADLRCPHVTDDSRVSLCMPLMGQGEALGMLHLLTQAPTAPQLEAKQQLALTVGDRVGLGLANLRLQETLRNLSVRDPLTGLFNRR
ncbi:MAG: PAS domain-containing protein, partial [Proteobacteria bacterium]|nr:PAS domain-containing protein [Pseudomonadota bacterium]